MAGNDILLAGLRHTHSLGREGCLILADEIERLNTALAERDATIERLTKERSEFARSLSEWAAKAGEAEGRLTASEWPGVVEGWKERAETAERERDEARAEVERKDAALAPFADMADYIDAETEGVSDADEVDVMFHDFLLARWPISHFRCARAALTAKGCENGGS